MEERTDGELVVGARTGDKEAFGTLVERYQHMAERMAVRMVADDELARELVQESILQAYLSLDYLRNAGSFRSWLCGIVLNVCRSYLRREAINTLSWESLEGGMRVDISTLGTEPDPGMVAEERELHQKVLQAVCALPQAERAATLLFYYGQRSLQEIAALLGISVPAVKVRLHRARERLRDQLWPVYTETELASYITPRRSGMVKVTVEDVRRIKEKENKGYVVVFLVDEAGRRHLPIWIGEGEGMHLAALIRQTQLPRPLTTVLMANLLRASGSDVEDVRIITLKGDVFYAIIKLWTPNGTQEVDARPSDAITLAAHMGRPIYASEEVFTAAGFEADDFLEQVRVTSLEKGQEFTWEESLLTSADAPLKVSTPKCGAKE